MYCKACGGLMNDNQVACLKCGVAAGKGNGYCPNCGNAVHEEAVICVKCGASLKDNRAETADFLPNVKNIGTRSIAAAIILSLVTCGIYSIYWFVVLTNEINQASGKSSDTSGGVAFLLTLVTCGIYAYYWAYKMGEKRDVIANENGSSNILYLILTLLGFGIIVYALLQDSLNKAIEKD